MDDERAKLAWRCRRGMRELDVLLRGFLDRHYAALDSAGRKAFAQLLEENDQDILAWLTGRSDPADPALAEMIRTIRSTASGE